MMFDYPAAHSMDTEWFAVDASGNLAMFDSGEGGAVPESNSRAMQTTSSIEWLDGFLLEMSENNQHRCISLNIPGAAVAKSLTLKKLERGIHLALQKKEKVLYSWLLQLSSDEAIAPLGIEEIKDNYLVRFAGEPIIIYVEECRLSILRQLVENELIIAGQQLGQYDFRLASLFGLFVFEQDSCYSLPYRCTGKPILPLCLDDLPEHLQDAVSWNWFDRVEFSESKEIQPIEHMRCQTWGGD